MDPAGNAYVTGFTISTNFPTVNAFKSTLDQGDFYSDAFVTKLNAAGSALVYSTYLGGNAEDTGYGLAVDSAGNAYVAGLTTSRCFPTTTGAFDTTLSLGNSDAFITKISETAQPSALTPCPSQLLNLATRLRVLTRRWRADRRFHHLGDRYEARDHSRHRAIVDGHSRRTGQSDPRAFQIRIAPPRQQ